MSTKPLDDIEMFNGGWWFTAYETPKGIIAGPFKTQREAQDIKKTWQAPVEVAK